MMTKKWPSGSVTFVELGWWVQGCDAIQRLVMGMPESIIKLILLCPHRSAEHTGKNGLAINLYGRTCTHIRNAISRK